MNDIKFEVDQAPQVNLSTAKESILAKWIVKLGITDNIATANYILLAIAILFIGITIFMYVGIFSEPTQVPLSIDEQQAMNDMSLPFN